MCADRDIRPKRGQRGWVGGVGGGRRQECSPQIRTNPKTLFEKAPEIQTGQRLMAFTLRAPLRLSQATRAAHTDRAAETVQDCFSHFGNARLC